MDTINAAANPAQAQQMIEQVMGMVNTESTATESTDVPDVVPPLDTVVDLPGGYLAFTGEVAHEAEVRELNGRDEEALAKISATDKLLQEALVRGTVRVGKDAMSEEVANNLLAGDRDYLLLRIFMASFGPTLQVTPFCRGCGRGVEAELELAQIPVRRLDSPQDRRFTLECSRGPVRVDLPNGHTQRQMIAAADRSAAELSTIMLSNVVTEINGRTVLGAGQVLDLSIRDRRKIIEEVVGRSPGPQMQDATCRCPNCDSTLEVPLSLANLFRFQ